MGGNRLKQKIISIKALILIAALLTGCAENKELSVPELIEPADILDAYSPAKIDSIYNATYLVSTVVGKDYCYFLKSKTLVKEICVDLGQYVKKGDVLAIMDLGELEYEEKMHLASVEGLEQIKQQQLITDSLSISVKNREYELLDKAYKKICEQNCEIYGEYARDPELKLDETTEYYMKRDEEEAKKAREEAEISLKLEKENASYNALLAEHKITIEKEEIDRIQKLKSRGSIVADNDGYVTYIKDLSEGNSAAGFENIVIVTDTNDLSLEINDTYGSSFYNELNNRKGECYAIIGSEKYPVSPHKFSNPDYVAMESSKLYANMTFELDGDIISKAGIKAGESVILMFVWGKAEDVLCVANDSIYSSDEGSFVYVKENDTKEKRFISPGFSNGNYTQVIDGIKEGELIYSSTKDLPPGKSETLTIKRSDFLPRNSMAIPPVIEYTKSHSFSMDKESTVANIFCENAKEVKKGDKICALRLPEGQSLLTEKENEFENKNQSIEAMIVEYKKERYSLKDEIAKQEDLEQKDLLALKLSLLDEKEALDNQKIELERKLSHLELSYTQQNVSSDGCKYYIADMDGVLADLSVTEGKRVAKDDEETALFRILDKDSIKVSGVIGEEFIYPGNEIAYINKDDDSLTYKGNIIGNTARTGKVYLSEYEDRTYVTQSLTEKKNKFYADAPEEILNNPSKYEIYYPKFNVHNAIVIPNKAVHNEVKIGESGKTYYYVWQLVDDNPIKTYIDTIAEINTEKTCVFGGIDEDDVILVEQGKGK